MGLASSLTRTASHATPSWRCIFFSNRLCSDRSNWFRSCAFMASTKLTYRTSASWLVSLRLHVPSVLSVGLLEKHTTQRTHSQFRGKRAGQRATVAERLLGSPRTAIRKIQPQREFERPPIFRVFDKHASLCPVCWKILSHGSVIDGVAQHRVNPLARRIPISRSHSPERLNLAMVPCAAAHSSSPSALMANTSQRQTACVLPACSAEARATRLVPIAGLM